MVFGWNPGQKQNANLGKKSNQNFVQIPTARLKARIQQLCQQYGIQFVETEEAYSSQASFLDGDSLRASQTDLNWQLQTQLSGGNAPR